ncbi:MAG: DUF4384 domain-containing protein [Blastocatellia bacterium]
MKSIIFHGIFPAAILACLAAVSPAQSQGDDKAARDFVATRGSSVVRLPSSPKLKTPPANNIGLGYTIFKKNAAGKPARVKESHRFRSGDEIRLMIESNITGYLYIFTTENDGPPEMIFPDPRLRDGGNRIQAHVPYEAPSGQEEDPDFRWFHFNENAGVERLYLIVTREPMSGVLAGEKLVDFCREHPNDCPWKPSDSFWNQLLANANTETRESENRASGQAQSSVERQAVARGLGLPHRAPKPQKVRMNTSPQSRMLVVRVDLAHQ